MKINLCKLYRRTAVEPLKNRVLMPINLESL